MGVVTRRQPTYLHNQGATRRHSPDYLLLLLMVALAAVGVVVVFSISPALEVEKGVNGNQHVFRQLIAIALGLGIFTAAASVPIARWRTLYKPLLVVAAVATLLALVMPVNAQYPAHRWIRIGGFSFQSVELLKFAGIMWLSSFLAWRIDKGLVAHMNKTIKPLFFAFVACGVIVAALQSDLGSFGVIVAIMAAITFAAGMPMKRVLAFGAIIIVAVGLLIISTPYRRDRLATFMNPERDCLVSGYQACQALIAVGSGGMIGLGLGRSVQAYGYLPEAENDSIFAIYAEKFGFIGVTALIGLFAALFSRIKRIMERAPDNFSRFLVLGILVWLSAQTIINIGAMVGLLPLKGITLPLVSYGGSSVLMVMAALGVVFQVSRHTLYSIPETESSAVNGGAGYENSRDRRRVRGAYNSRLGRRT
ncbi:MAG TPA: putative peptidoglycan glycosyltransferase FtsW [Candidatus Saccharimonadales bacterium]